MSAKFMFDECLGKPMMEELRSLIPGQPLFAHVCDYFSSGVLDKDWLSKIGDESGWIVISADRGKKTNRGGKLPELCKENKITHVLLSSTLHKKSSGEKVAALRLVWDQISALDKQAPGSRFVLRYRANKSGSLSITLLPATSS